MTGMSLGLRDRLTVCSGSLSQKIAGDSWECMARLSVGAETVKGTLKLGLRGRAVMQGTGRCRVVGRLVGRGWVERSGRLRWASDAALVVDSSQDGIETAGV